MARALSVLLGIRALRSRVVLVTCGRFFSLFFSGSFAEPRSQRRRARDPSPPSERLGTDQCSALVPSPPTTRHVPPVRPSSFPPAPPRRASACAPSARSARTRSSSPSTQRGARLLIARFDPLRLPFDHRLPMSSSHVAPSDRRACQKTKTHVVVSCRVSSSSSCAPPCVFRGHSSTPHARGATDLAEQHGLVQRVPAADRAVAPRVDGRLVDAVCREHGARRALRHRRAGRRLRDVLRERERVVRRGAPRALELRLYITLHYIALYYITVQYSTVQYITLPSSCASAVARPIL